MSDTLTTTRERTEDRMRTLIHALGPSQETVVGRLRGAGVTGNPHSLCDCIIARYLTKGLGADPGQVSVGFVTAGGPHGAVVLDIPMHVAQVIMDWIDGKYPDLLDSEEGT